MSPPHNTLKFNSLNRAFYIASFRLEYAKVLHISYSDTKNIKMIEDWVVPISIF